MDLMDVEDLFGGPVSPDRSENQENEPPHHSSDDGDNVQRYENDNPRSQERRADDDQQEANLELSKVQGKEGEKKKVVRNPQPKLDPDRICGKRGIGQLESIFQDFKPKGKGHEYDDLDIVLKKMEHWAHRLYPKLPFRDVMDRISVLGKKQAVKTYVKKVRMGMVSLSNKDPDVINDDDDDEEDTTQRYETEQPPEEDIPPDNEFDKLMEELEDNGQSQQQELGMQSQSYHSQSQPHNTTHLTQEQKERMEANKRKALEKRRQTLEAKNIHEDIDDINFPSKTSDVDCTVFTSEAQVRNSSQGSPTF